MALNYRRVGKPGNAVAVIIAAVLALVVLVTFFALVPVAADAPSVVVGLAQATLMLVVANVMQGHMLEQHLQHGGTTHSVWWGAGIGCLTGIVLALVLLAILLIALTAEDLELVGFGLHQVP